MDDFVCINSPTTDTVFAPMPKKQAGATPVAPLTFLEAHPFVRQTVIDKIYGCIIGSALGDTIGLYTEFLTKDQSKLVYPERKYRLVEPATMLHQDYHRTRFASCAWTDDTDQALLIILSYLHTTTSLPHDLSTAQLSQDFAARLRIWIQQALLALDRHACGIGQLVGSIVTQGNYLTDPLGIATQKWVNSGRYLAPNGSLMRTHPIGVIGVQLSEEETWALSVAVGRTTHVDPRCVVACCIEVALIRGLLRGEIVDEKGLNACVERSYAWVLAQPELMNPGLDESLSQFEIERHLERKEFDKHVYVESLEELKLDSPKVIGYVYKCLGSAVLLLRLAMRQNKILQVPGGPLATETLFEDLMVDLIMEGGDADTNGAAAGALLGAYLGYTCLPSHWTLGLAHKDWLEAKTGRLAVATGAIKGTLQPEKDEKEDGGVGLKSKKELEHRDALLWADISKKLNDAKEKERRAKEKKKSIAGWFTS